MSKLERCCFINPLIVAACELCGEWLLSETKAVDSPKHITSPDTTIVALNCKVSARCSTHLSSANKCGLAKMYSNLLVLDNTAMNFNCFPKNLSSTWTCT